jgi:hypothetical protein
MASLEVLVKGILLASFLSAQDKRTNAKQKMISGYFILLVL